MARLTRKNINVFAGSASNNGVFGSLQAGNATVSNDVETIQSLAEAWSGGWNYATLTGEKLPPLEEFQGVQYVTTYQQAYLMQEGMPEWAATVTYYKGSLVKKVTTTGFQIYNSLTDDNTNHQLSDTSNWKLVMDSDNLYALDNAVVHKAGAETITGAKTFTSTILEQANFSIQSTTLDKGNPPSSPIYQIIAFHDKNGVNQGSKTAQIYTEYTNGGLMSFNMQVFKPLSGNTTTEKIAIYYPASGNPYTYAPTPTTLSDTSSNNGQIVNVGYLNSSNSGVVHLSGTETITGAKTFTQGKSGWINVKTTSIAYTETPSSTVGNVYGGFTFLDKNGTKISDIYTAYYTGGGGFSGISLVNHAQASETIGLYFDANGTFYTRAPASDKAESIVTTISRSKSANGYFKLGNGLIIQWGTLSSATTTGTLTFPLEWPSTNYMVVGNTNQNINRGDQVVAEFFTKKTKNCKYNSSYACQWIAVGY